MPGGVWGEQFRNQQSGFYGAQAPKPLDSYHRANQFMLGGGDPNYFGRGASATQTRQFADVGKYNVNLLDPLDTSRANVDYVPIDDGGPLGMLNTYYNPMTPGGLFAGVLGAVGEKITGALGQPKLGSDIGTFLGKTIEAPLGIIGAPSVQGVPFIAPVIDALNSQVEKFTPYILRDTFKIPKDVGGAFQSMLSIFGLAGTAIERTYAGMDARGALPTDIEERVEAGELTRDQGFDEMVLSARGFSDNPMHNLLWALLTDPANYASLGVGAVGGAVRGTAKTAMAFGAAVRAGEAGTLQRVAAQGGRLAELAAMAERNESLIGQVGDRSILTQMRGAIDNPQARLQLSMVERMGMSALGPVSEETGALVARVGNYILRATDPSAFFSGSKAGARSLGLLSTSASTAVIAAHGADTIHRLTGIADGLVGDGGDRVMRAVGSQGTNGLQEYGLSDLATDAMKSGEIPRTGTLTPTEAVRELLRGGAYDTNVGKYIEMMVEKTKDMAVGMLPPQQMYEQSVAKFAAILGVDPGAVAARMKSVSSDEAITIHALYYFTKGESLHTDVARALEAAQQAGTLAKNIDPELNAIISPRTVTDVSVKQIEDAVKTGDVGLVRMTVEKFDNFNWLHSKNVPDADLLLVVRNWLDSHEGRHISEVQLKDATGAWLPGIPEELKKWAQDSEAFGYKLGQRMPINVPEEDLWRLTRGPDGEILNADPYSDFWAEGQSAKRINRFQAVKMTMFRSVRQERIVWRQRRRFITDMAKASEDNGVDVPPILADRIFKAIMYEAKDRFIQPRGMEPREMYAAAKRVVDDFAKNNDEYADVAKRLTERQVVLGLLRATQGDIKLVGVTQRITGGIKAYAPGASANYWGRISERLFPLMRFTLNPVFQTMELSEPYVLMAMRGIKLPLKRDSEGYQSALASRNAYSQLIRLTQGDADGLAAETAEALAVQAYQKTEASSKFGRGSWFGRWSPHIGERKDVAMALQTRRLLGDNMHAAFSQILGPRMEAFWADLAYEYGTHNRGQIAERWLAANFGIQNMDGHTVVVFDDILKPNSLGKRFRVTPTGEMGSYTFADVERVLDYSREHDGKWTQGMRHERGLKPGEALQEDLKNMSLEEWMDEIKDVGINSDSVTRVTDSAAHTIWKMANGPEMDEFWNGTKLPGGGRKDGFRNTFLSEVTGTDAVWTRVARDTEIARIRAIVQGWARAKGMTEEEFIKLHADDIPRRIDRAAVEPGSLAEVRGAASGNANRGWAEEALSHGPGQAELVNLDEVNYAFRNFEPHPMKDVLEETEMAGEHLMLRVQKDALERLQDDIRDGSPPDVRGMPSKGYSSATSMVADTQYSDVVLRVPRSTLTYMEDAYTHGTHFISKAELKPDNLEMLTERGWVPVTKGVGGKVAPPVTGPRMVNAEVRTGRDIYRFDESETGVTEIDLKELFHTETERAAQRVYVGSDHRIINGYLRGMDANDPDDYYYTSVLSDDDLDEIVGNLDRAIAKGQLRTPLTLYRGMNLTRMAAKDRATATFYRELQPDAVFPDAGFFSTSNEELTARQFAGLDGYGGRSQVGVVFTVKAPAGMHATLLVDEGEGEHLFGRDIVWRVVDRKEVFSDSSGLAIHLTIVPEVAATAPGVMRMGVGDLPGELRSEGRFLEDAMNDPEGLRARLAGVPEEQRADVSADIEAAIAKAQAAAPQGERVTIGNHSYGPRTGDELLDEIETVLDPDEITAGVDALPDLRYRVGHAMESEQWAPTGERGVRQVEDHNDDRILTSLASTLEEHGGFRFGLQGVLRVVERFWTLGASGATGKGADAVSKTIITNLARGVKYGIKQPVYTNRGSDMLDAIFGNTSRRASGRTTTLQPILHTDGAAEAAGFYTPSAHDDLAEQGLLPGVVSPTAIPTGPTTRVQALKGTTGPVLVEDPATGLRYVEKGGATPGHAAEELAADKAYAAAGVPVPKAEMVGGVKRAEYIEGGRGLDTLWDEYADEPLAGFDEAKAQLQEGFALDALLANWDVVGLEGDNILIKDGIAYRIDNGGSLRFRAQGGDKGPQFGTSVSELQRMRGGGNEWQQRIFGDLPDAEVRRQILDLGPRLDAIVAGMPADVAATVRLRYQNMLDQTADITPAPAKAAVGPTPTIARPEPLGEYEHEWLTKFYNDAAVRANERGLNGKSTWTAAELSNVAAQARTKMGRRTGQGISMPELERAWGEVHVALTPGGPGSELESLAPVLELFSQKRYRAQKHKLLRHASSTVHEGLRDTLGAIIESTDEVGVGLFDGENPAPLMSTYLLNTPEHGQSLADAIAFVTGQPVVRMWSPGPPLREITDFKSVTARVNLVLPPSDLTPKMAEQIAEAIGKRWPEADDMIAVRGANRSWHLQIKDTDGTLLPRLESGAVDIDALHAMLDDLLVGDEFKALDDMAKAGEGAGLAVDYGHVYEARPPTNADGSIDWDGHASAIEQTSTANGSPIRSRDLHDIRATYNWSIRDQARAAAPKQVERTDAGLPIVGRDLEDRRGGNLLGVTSRRGDNSAVIRGLAAADPVTGLHELIHVFSIAGMDESMRTVVSQAFDQYHVGNTAAQQAKLAILQNKLAATTHNRGGAQKKLKNEINALQHGLRSPHPTAWGKAQEEFFVSVVFEWIKKGTPPDNPDLANAFEHFRNWLNITEKELQQPGMVPIHISPAMEATLGKMFRTPGRDTVSYSVEQQTLRMAGQQALRSSMDEAHTTQFYKKDRSMVERSINHQYIGLYPASYMWGKILPEMLRFLALRPFGMETPFLGWNIAREVSDSVSSQAELDEGFKKFLDDNEDAFMLFSMMFPGLPHDIPANASLPLRRIAEQGLEHQQAFARGGTAESVGDIDFGKGAMDAVQYAVGPLGTIRTVTEVAGMSGDFIRSALGEALPEDESELLSLR